MEPFIGQIVAVVFNYAPQGWLLCDGTIYPMAQFQALFTLIGSQYGGDGRTTFGVPNLQGRTPIGMGPNHKIAQMGGFENFALTAQNLPPHSHVVYPLVANTASGNSPVKTYSAATTATGTAGSAQVKINVQSFASAPAGVTAGPYYTGPDAAVPSLPSPSAPVIGTPIPIPMQPPFSVVNYIICWNGLYPSRP